MLLRPISEDRAIEFHARYLRLRERFGAFLAGLDWLVQANCPIKGVVVAKAPDGDACSISFTTVTIRLAFAMSISADSGVPTGNVVCTLMAPAFQVEPPVIASFTFNGNGTTNFEVPQGEDPVNMSTYAVDIALHLLGVALARPMPLA